MHPGTYRLEKCLEALANDKSAKVNTRLVPALNVYVSPKRVEVAHSKTHYQVMREVTARRHLPQNSVRVAVEYAPFALAKENSRSRPTYVLEVNGDFFESEEKITQVFEPLLKKHNLQPDQIAGRHWNFGNKTQGNLFSVSLDKNGQTVALTAHTREGLLELANHYFHYALPGQEYTPRAAKVHRSPSITIALNQDERKDAKWGQKVFHVYDEVA